MSDTATRPRSPSSPARPHPRRGRRDRLLRRSALPALLLLLVAGRLGLLALTADDARSAYDDGRAERAATLWGRNRVAAPVERWVAAFGAGTAAARAGDLAAGRRDLEEALAVVPPEHECEVRLNLALVVEAGGDGPGTPPAPGAATQAWRDARAVLAAGGCLEARDRPTAVDPASVPLVEDGADADDPEADDPGGTGAELVLGPVPAPVARSARAADARLAAKLRTAQRARRDASGLPDATAAQRRRSEALRQRQQGALATEAELRDLEDRQRARRDGDGEGEGRRGPRSSW